MINLPLLFAIGCLLVVAVSILVLILRRKKAQVIKNPLILGKWEGNKHIVEIFKDGRTIITDKLKQECSIGCYKFIDDNTIRVKFEGSKSQKFKVSISQDRLTFYYAQGRRSVTYRKVQ
jgi:ferredoxin-like protein FixX